MFPCLNFYIRFFSAFFVNGVKYSAGRKQHFYPDGLTLRCFSILWSFSPQFIPFSFSLSSLRLNHHGNHQTPSEEESWSSAPPILLKSHPHRAVVLRCAILGPSFLFLIEHQSSVSRRVGSQISYTKKSGEVDINKRSTDHVDIGSCMEPLS